jgi:hypothetical protein
MHLCIDSNAKDNEVALYNVGFLRVIFPQERAIDANSSFLNVYLRVAEHKLNIENQSKEESLH